MHILKKQKIYRNTYLLVSPNKNNTNDFLISKIIKLTKKNSINLLLSGGNTLKFFLSKLINNEKLLSRIKIFITDERLVNKNSHLSNEKKINFYLNKSKKNENGLNSILNLVSPPIDNHFLNNLNLSYPNSDKFPLAIMGIGYDGHIASIFFTNTSIIKKNEKFIIVKKNNENFNRVSLKLKYLISLPNIIFVVEDIKKNSILKSIVKYNGEKPKYPITKLIKQSRGKIYIITSKYFIDRI